MRAAGTAGDGFQSIALSHADLSMSQAHPTLNLASLRLACKQCSARDLCLPFGLSEDDMARLDRIVDHPRPLRHHDFLFRAGEPMRSVYAVRSGSVKTGTLSAEGAEQVTGFHLPGELVGLDAIASGHHVCNAQALETTSLCELPFEGLESLAQQIPSLQHQLLRLMSQEIRQSDRLLALGRKSAESRLADFLLLLSRRFQARGLSAHEFTLSMTRTEIANYLGLTLETVSRLFTRLQAQGVITLHGRLLHVICLQELEQRAGAVHCVP